MEMLLFLQELWIEILEPKVDKEDVHIVCILPGRTFKNDMLSRRLETGEQIRITRGV